MRNIIDLWKSDPRDEEHAMEILAAFIRECSVSYMKDSDYDFGNDLASFSTSLTEAEKFAEKWNIPFSKKLMIASLQHINEDMSDHWQSSSANC